MATEAEKIEHTPGPWACSENAYGAVFVHGGETLTSSIGTEYKALVAGGNSHDTLTLANARLIAAAPDLLAALREAALALDGLAKGEGVFKPIEQTVVLARTAISKAEGRS